MPYRNHYTRRRLARPSLVPLTHPSWAGYPDGLDLSQRLAPADFWQRLGL